ncbi:hypothetical protein GCM10009868_26090 [Terrabacter aerolatus]|uniref:Uncharacterized protein n=1 Tax=Terrabacter aerolatus TaxID=422442 RepID=A0A512D5W1_9MICO|nr:hypothetical protein [Terrabacter aerolatus]GEO31630.1 hypothetical protein TAE01_34400 [Terrabacter aerolatus]
MSTSTPDLFTSLRNGWVDALQQWTDASQSLWDEVAAPFTGGGSAPSGSAWTAWPAWGQQRSRPTHDHGHDHRHDHRHDHGHDHGPQHDEPRDHGHDHGHDGHRHDEHHHGHHGCGEGRECGGCGGSRGCGECRGECGCGWGCGEHGDARGGSTCGCGGACSCCVPDADVVVHTRVGERRIVPLALHNAWRRERPVTLAVGPWHVGSDTDLVVVAVLEEEQVTLAPCEDRIVRLVIGVTTTTGAGGKPGDGSGGAGDPGKPGGSSDANGPSENQGGSDVHLDTHVGMGQGRMPGDLDACASAYADVRFEGCSRPLRVAVVVSPAPCHPVEAGCDCGCC